MKVKVSNKIRITVPELLSGASVPCVMGILNVTEDSFSDGGAYCHTQSAVEKALQLFDAGSVIVDLGAESTRPGAGEICAQIQTARLIPVIRGIFARKKDALLSVDTRHSKVAQAVLEEGVQIINDVSGLTFDPEMGQIIASFDACAVLMHMRGTPETMRSAQFCQYDDVVREVGTSLQKIRDRAYRCGIGKNKLILDAGIGFAKTPRQDLELIRNASLLREKLETPLLYGVSRKSFLQTCIGERSPAERDFATMGVVCALCSSRVEFLRVHEVQGTCDALRCFTACTANGN